jgi:hypothetical protein
MTSPGRPAPGGSAIRSGGQTMLRKIGFIGLGAIGMPMARNL